MSRTPIGLTRISGEIRSRQLVFLWLALIALLAGCEGGLPALFPTPTPTITLTATITLTPTPTATPTPTPIPLAARVNGEGIRLDEFQAALSQYVAATGTNLASSDDAHQARQTVLDDLIEKTLLAQGAAEQGLTLEERMVDERLAQLAEGMGGARALEDWQAAQGYSAESFRHALRREMAAAWMRDIILAETPESAEQIHARQILHYNADDARQILAQLENGADFAALALYYDPVAGGDLGWFPRGYLNAPELDEPVFALEPGQFSQVIESRLGYHIVQVIAREAQRPLSLEAHRKLQALALQNWLEERRAASEIQILLP